MTDFDPHTEPPETVLVPDETPRRRVALTVVTSSELQSFRDCPHKWSLSHVRGLRPVVAPRALAFGSAVHAGLAAAIAEPVHAVAAEAGVAAVAQAQARWFKERLDAGDASADALDALAVEASDAAALASWMVQHYVETFAEDWRWLVPLAIERPFSLRCQNVKGLRVGHLGYAGVWDLVALDRRHGDLIVADHKTTSGNVDSIDRRVELDPQIAGYVWALRRSLWDASADLGETRLALPDDRLTNAEAKRIEERKVATGRVIYNVLRKKAPSTPKVNKDGKVSVAAIDTFAAIYESALNEQEGRGIPRTAEQSALLEKLASKGDPFLSRREFHRGDDEIERWRREVFVEASRIRAAEADENQRTRNPGHCTMPWSMACSYRRPCLNPDDVDGFRVIDTKHEEVEQAKEAEEP